MCTAWILQYFLNHCLITDTSSVLESLYSAFHCVDTQNVFKTHLLTFLHLILTMRYCSYFFMLLLFVSWCDIFILSFWVCISVIIYFTFLVPVHHILPSLKWGMHCRNIIIIKYWLEKILKVVQKGITVKNSFENAVEHIVYMFAAF